MGARIIRKRVRARKDARNLAIILSAVCAPVALLTLLVAADIKADLSGIAPREGATLDGTTISSWKTLEASDQPRQRQISSPVPGENQLVIMLGYMMEGNVPVPDGTQVSTFVLMPDAGSWIHPAHREPDEMVEVTLLKPAHIPFANRRLVWVKGRLQQVRFSRHYGEALYGISEARVVNASDKAITEYFLP